MNAGAYGNEIKDHLINVSGFKKMVKNLFLIMKNVYLKIEIQFFDKN